MKVFVDINRIVFEKLNAAQFWTSRVYRMTPRSMMDAFEKLICCRKKLVLDEELAVARACAHSPEISKIIQLWNNKKNV